VGPEQYGRTEHVQHQQQQQHHHHHRPSLSFVRGLALWLSESAYRIYSKSVQVRKCFHQRLLPNITDCMLHVDGGRMSMSSQPRRCNLSSAVLVSMEVASTGLTESVMSTINQLSESSPPTCLLNSHPPSLIFSARVNVRGVEKSKDHRKLITFHPRNHATICIFSISLYYTGNKKTSKPSTRLCLCILPPKRHAKKPAHDDPSSSNACTPSVRGYSKECQKGISRPRPHSIVEVVSSAPLSIHVAPTASGVPDPLCCIIVVCQSWHF
jgi:hypothetical protein